MLEQIARIARMKEVSEVNITARPARTVIFKVKLYSTIDDIEKLHEIVENMKKLGLEFRRLIAEEDDLVLVFRLIEEVD